MSNDMSGGAVFSIIVPVYNVSEYLRRCLDSLINQTFSDIEIIVYLIASFHMSPMSPPFTNL